MVVLFGVGDYPHLEVPESFWQIVRDFLQCDAGERLGHAFGNDFRWSTPYNTSLSAAARIRRPPHAHSP
jgi:hypothetical protein